MTDYKTLWVPIHRRLQSNSDFIHFVELFGSDQASRLFRRHVNALREEFVKQKENWYLSQLDAILREILPDLNTISDRSAVQFEDKKLDCNLYIHNLCW